MCALGNGHDENGERDRRKKERMRDDEGRGSTYLLRA
jgi:hypothetical protein